MSSGSAEAALRAAGAVTEAVDARDGGPHRQRILRRPSAGPSCRARRAPWDSVCSTMSPSVRCMPAPCMGSSESRSSISMCITATGRRISFSMIANLFYASTHQYPSLSRAPEAAPSDGVAGNVVNVPLAPGAGSRSIPRRFEGRILPAARTIRTTISLHLCRL